MTGRTLFAMALAGTISAASLVGYSAPVFAKDAEKSAAVAVQAPAGTYVLDGTHAAVLFSYRHNGISDYIGRFQKIDATLKLDPKNIEKSSITFKVDPRSVQTSYPADYSATHPGSTYKDWNDELIRNPDFLNAEKFPEASFVSTKVERTGPETAKVTGNLTFLGVTHPMTFDAKFLGEIPSHPFMKVPAVGFSAVGTFDRTAFGQKDNMIGHEVTIRFNGEFIQQPDAK